jgi:hypothetical protein
MFSSSFKLFFLGHGKKELDRSTKSSKFSLDPALSSEKSPPSFFGLASRSRQQKMGRNESLSDNEYERQRLLNIEKNKKLLK